VCLDNTTLPARPVTRNCLRPCHCGLIPVYYWSVSFSCLRSAVGVSFDIKKACRKPYRTFYQKNNHQAPKYMGLGSGIWEKAIPDPIPGVKKAPDPGSGSATLLSVHLRKLLKVPKCEILMSWILMIILS
jgi:hypothetical protein